ncbi:MAG: TfoX/Sxy family protein [Pseudolabrys sp.]
MKTDDAGSAAFAAENCAPFGYDTKGGRRVLTSYWRIPERLYDDPAELARWAQAALSAAQRTGRKPARTKRKARR